MSRLDRDFVVNGKAVNRSYPWSLNVCNLTLTSVHIISIQAGWYQVRCCVNESRTRTQKSPDYYILACPEIVPKSDKSRVILPWLTGAYLGEGHCAMPLLFFTLPFSKNRSNVYDLNIPVSFDDCKSWPSLKISGHASHGLFPNPLSTTVNCTTVSIFAKHNDD